MTVLDASALLAFLGNEPGRDPVGAALATGECLISALNWSEVCQKQVQHDLPRTALSALSELLEIVPVTRDHGEAAASLWPSARFLSIADRVCLALAIEREVVVLTCDRAWADADIDVQLEIVR